MAMACDLSSHLSALGEAGKQDILQQMSRNSRSQIVFRTDIFQKLTLGAPGLRSEIQHLTLF